MSEWQDISAAPKDGSRVLVYGECAGELSGPHGEDAQVVAMWAGGSTDFPGFDWLVPDTDFAAKWVKPKAWQPLPTPPHTGKE